jgi:hypothetical protein
LLWQNTNMDCDSSPTETLCPKHSS